MANKRTVLEILIASPSDVRPERDQVRDSIEAWNRAHSNGRGYLLQALAWETDAVSEYGMPPQDSLNRQLVDRCDAVIALFGTRLGTATRAARSGTVEEIQRAHEAGKPVMVYFSRRPVDPTTINLEQFKALRDFKTWCETRSLFREYDSLQGLSEQLALGLTRWVDDRPKRRAVKEPRSPALEARYAELVVANCERLSGSGLLRDLAPAARGAMTIRELYIPLWFRKVPTRSTAESEPLDLKACFEKTRSLIFLGGAGTGKTTLVQWLAILSCGRAMKSAADGPAAIDDIPADIRLPIVIRCRDLDPERRSDSFDDLLAGCLTRLGLNDTELKPLQAELLKCVQRGSALVAFDGVDEIAPSARQRFGRQIAQLRRAYPEAYMVVTCRAGDSEAALADLQADFTTFSLAPLTRGDRIDFVERVCSWIDSDSRKEQARTLIAELDQLPTLGPITEVPLLFNVALFLRLEEGRWPPKRSAIFERACRALVDWKPTDDERRRRPVLVELAEFAYALSLRNQRTVSDEEVPELALAEDVLALAERCHLMVRTGPSFALGARRGYEFTHTLVQAYLAARALTESDEATVATTMANRLTSSAADEFGASSRPHDGQTLWDDIWRFFSELVDAKRAEWCLRVILETSHESELVAMRPAAILAGFCIAHQPTLPMPLVRDALALLASSVRGEGRGHVVTPMDEAAWELARSASWRTWHEVLIAELQRRNPMLRTSVFGLASSALAGSLPTESSRMVEWCNTWLQGLFDPDEGKVLSSIAFVHYWAPRLTPALPVVHELLSLLPRTGAVAVAAAAALNVLNDAHADGQQWHPAKLELQALRAIFDAGTEPEVLVSLAQIFERERALDAVGSLSMRLDHPVPEVQAACVSALDSIVRDKVSALDESALDRLVSRLLERGLERNHMFDFPAVRILGVCHDSRAIEPLFELLERRLETSARAVSDPAIQTLIQALGRLGVVRLVEVLLPLLHRDRRGDATRAVIDALGWLRDPRALEPLSALAGDPVASGLRISIAEALGDMSDPRALTTLEALRNDPNEVVARRANESIQYLRECTPSTPPRYRHYGLVVLSGSFQRVLRRA